METQLKKCPACDKPFEWNEYVVYVKDNEEYYHETCIELYPVGYYAMIDGEPLGEVENSPDWAMSVLDEGEYAEEEEK